MQSESDSFRGEDVYTNFVGGAMRLCQIYKVLIYAGQLVGTTCELSHLLHERVSSSQLR